MIDIFEAYATDETKEIEGVWEDIGGGTELLVARAENENYIARALELLEANQEALDTLPPDEKRALDKKIMLELIAETLLLGWKNLKYKGKVLKYSKENAIMLLQHSDFRKHVMKIANDRARYQAKMDAEDSKN